MHSKHKEINLVTSNSVQNDLARDAVLDEGFYGQSGPSNPSRKCIEPVQRCFARHTWSVKSYLCLESGLRKDQSMDHSYARLKMMCESHSIIKRNARAFKKVSSKENPSNRDCGHRETFLSDVLIAASSQYHPPPACVSPSVLITAIAAASVFSAVVASISALLPPRPNSSSHPHRSASCEMSVESRMKLVQEQSSAHSESSAVGPQAIENNQRYYNVHRDMDCRSYTCKRNKWQPWDN